MTEFRADKRQQGINIISRILTRSLRGSFLVKGVRACPKVQPLGHSRPTRATGRKGDDRFCRSDVKTGPGLCRPSNCVSWHGRSLRSDCIDLLIEYFYAQLFMRLGKNNDDTLCAVSVDHHISQRVYFLILLSYRQPQLKKVVKLVVGEMQFDLASSCWSMRQKSIAKTDETDHVDSGPNLIPLLIDLHPASPATVTHN